MARKTFILFSILFLITSVAFTAEDDPVRTEITAAKTQFPDSDAVIIFDRVDTIYKENGAAVTTEEILINFRDESAISEYQTLHYDYNPQTAHIRFMDVKIYRADGETVETIPASDMITEKAPADSIFWNFDMTICPLPLLDEGDSLYYKIERRGLNLAYLADNPGTPAWERDFVPPQPGFFMDTLYFEHEKFPMIEKTCTLRGPKTKPLQFATANGRIQATLKFEDDDLVYKFRVEEQPAYTPEPFSPEFSQAALKLALAAHPSWEMKSKWAYEHNEPQFIISEEMQKKVDEIISDAETDQEKMFRLLHWTAEEIRYLGLDMGEGEGHMVHPTDEIFAERIGVCKDKAAILVSMLRAAGFETYFVMTLAMEKTINIPSDDRFNHGVVAVRHENGEWTFLDPTWAPQNRPLFNYLEQQQPLLIAAPEGVDLTAVPYSEPEKSPLKIDAKSTVMQDGSVISAMTIETDGFFDGRARNYLSSTDRRFHQYFFNHLLDDIAEDAEIIDFEFTDPMDYSQPMCLYVYVSFPRLARVYDDVITVTPPLLSHPYADRYESDYLHVANGPEKRSHDLELICTRQIDFSETVTFPKNWKIEKSPDPVELDSAGIAFTFKGESEKDNRYRYDETITIKYRWTSHDDYPEIRKVVKKINDYREETILLTRNSDKSSDSEPPKKKSPNYSSGKNLPEEAAQIIRKELNVSLDDSGRMAERFETAIKVFNYEGRDEFADSRFTFNTAIHQLTVHENVTVTSDGKKIESPENALNITLDFDAVDVPEYAEMHTATVSNIGVDYGSTMIQDVKRTTDDLLNGEMEYMTRIHEYAPVSEWELEVRIPATKELYYESFAVDSKPEITETDGVKSYCWRLADIERAVYEPVAGNTYTHAPTIITSTFGPDEWTHRLAPVQAAFFDSVTPEKSIVDRVEKLIEDDHTAPEKLQSFMDFIAQRIKAIHVHPRWLNYTTRPLDAILASGSGYQLDRLKLLRAFVEEIGGEFELCFYGDAMTTTDRIPCLWQFPEIAGRITLNDVVSYVHPDNGFLSVSDLTGQRILIVSGTEHIWLSMDNFKCELNACNTDIKLTVNPDKTLDGSMHIVLNGEFNRYYDFRSDVSKLMTRILPECVHEAKTVSFDIISLSPPPHGTTEILCKFTGKIDPSGIHEEKYYMNLPSPSQGFAAQHYRFPALSARINPVRLKFAGFEQYRIHIKFPEKWTVVPDIETVDINQHSYEFNQAVSLESNSVELEQKLVFSTDTMPPEVYASLVKIWNRYSMDKYRTIYLTIPRE